MVQPVVQAEVQKGIQEEEEESEELTGPFPGGPQNPRILRSFKTYIAVEIWNMKIQ